MPYWKTIAIRTADIAPVGPEIWNDAPEKNPITIPAIMAVTIPAAAVAPLLTPNARARGRATAQTVRPAIRSFKSFEAL